MVENTVEVTQLEKQGMVDIFATIHDDYLLYGKKKHGAEQADSDIDNQNLNEEGLFVKEEPRGLTQAWSCWASLLWVPASQIQSYFGEKIAFYFSFLSFYTLTLIVPSVVGLGVFIVDLALHNHSIEMAIVQFGYSVVIILWATLLHKYWV